MNVNLILNFNKSIMDDNSHRYKSWEHCYTVFKSSTEIDFISLHLGFYLASWGMYRGSSGLLQKDYTIHHGAIEILKDSKFKAIHFIGSNQLNLAKKKEHIDLIIDLKDELSRYYSNIKYTKGDNPEKGISPTDTLISKIMLGTFSCCPAYDRYYIDGLRVTGLKGFELTTESLNNLYAYIDEYINEITLVQKEIIKSSGIFYPVMKIMDMYFWSLGYEKENKLKQQSK